MTELMRLVRSMHCAPRVMTAFVGGQGRCSSQFTSNCNKIKTDRNPQQLSVKYTYASGHLQGCERFRDDLGR